MQNHKVRIVQEVTSQFQNILTEQQIAKLFNISFDYFMLLNIQFIVEHIVNLNINKEILDSLIDNVSKLNQAKIEQIRLFLQKRNKNSELSVEVFEILLNPLFSENQLNQIIEGLLDYNFPIDYIKIYAQECYNSYQMYEIKTGLSCLPVNKVLIYANPEYHKNQMKLIRLCLELREISEDSELLQNLLKNKFDDKQTKEIEYSLRDNRVPNELIVTCSNSELSWQMMFLIRYIFIKQICSDINIIMQAVNNLKDIINNTEDIFQLEKMVKTHLIYEIYSLRVNNVFKNLKCDDTTNMSTQAFKI